MLCNARYPHLKELANRHHHARIAVVEKMGEKHFVGVAERIEQAQARRGNPTPIYTVIIHEAKTRMNLTVNEYVLADSVHKLSGNHSATSGWCHASKAHLARVLGVSERSIFSLLNKLRDSGVVETHPDRPSLLRTTRKWHNTVEVLRARVYSK